MELRGKTAIVTGASSGFGRSTSRMLADAGVQVAGGARRIERLETEIRLPLDVRDPASCAAFVDAAVQQLGGVDILVTNAGGPPPGTFASIELDAYAPALELNLLSTVAMCHAAVPAMAEHGWGRVVAITSITVRQPAGMLILSNTARAGATAFLKTLATEVAPRGVTVNSVQPGLHATDRLLQLPHLRDQVGKPA